MHKFISCEYYCLYLVDEAWVSSLSLSLSLSHTHTHTCRPVRCLAIDCEMVGGGQRDSEYSMLARCSIVNHHGNIIYDSYVKPADTVVNYRTKYSGIKPELLTNGELKKLYI